MLEGDKFRVCFGVAGSFKIYQFALYSHILPLIAEYYQNQFAEVFLRCNACDTIFLEVMKRGALV